MDNISLNIAPNFSTVLQSFTERFKNRHEALKDAGRNYDKTQEKNKEIHDRKIFQQNIEVGDLVFVRIENRKNKLQPFYRGPYVCCRKKPKNSFWVKNIETGKKLRNAVHTGRMKLVKEVSDPLMQ